MILGRKVDGTYPKGDEIVKKVIQGRIKGE
jgi:hypothetical protein